MKTNWYIKIISKLGAILMFVACTLVSDLLANPLVLSDTASRSPLAGYAEVFEDKTAEVTFEEILSGKFADKFTGPKMQDYTFFDEESVFWIRFRVQNQSNLPTWILEYPIVWNLAVFDLYQATDSSGYQLTQRSATFPFDQRSIDYDYLTHQILIPSGETHSFYVKISARYKIDLKLLNLSTPGQFFDQASDYQILLGIYFGLIAALILYSFFNYVLLGRSIYLWYSLYILSVALLVAHACGKAFNVLFPDHPDFNEKAINLLSLLLFLCWVFYTQKFLRTAEKLKTIHAFLNFNIGVAILLIALTFIFDASFSYFMEKVIPPYGIGVFFYSGFRSLKLGDVSSRLFILGVACFATGTFVTALSSTTTLLPLNAYTSYSMHIGSAMEAILFMLGLSQQISIMKKEKEEAQAETIHHLEENKKLQKKVTLELEGKVKERTLEINLQKEIIEQKNKDITDSIIYAQRIQKAILPSPKYMQKVLGDYFVFFRPKDIVSGDFYWMDLAGGKSLFAAVDCTGHGVPGAFMSLLGYNGLHQAVSERKLSKPSEVLEELDRIVNWILQGRRGEVEITDGMDMALCAIDWEKMELEFSGAMNPVYILRDQEILMLRGDRQAIGGHLTKAKKFQNQTFPLKKNDLIYVFSDGFVDQFGGEKEKKFMKARLKKILIKNASYSMEQQKELLNNAFNDWKGRLSQVDDVLVIGVRVP